MSTAHDPHKDEHHDAGHHGNPWIQHHYDDAQHQFDSGKLGIWLFLAQEVLFFSALFVAYILYRVHHPEIYSYAHKYLDVKYGAINTGVLIFSSLTAAWAVRAAQLRQTKLLVGCIAVTIMCALAFLGIKYIEYSHKVHEHILFGRYFDPCVSPGGNELITKRNECPGSKGSPKWDFGANKAVDGCFQADKFDQDPHTSGWQLECKVEEIKYEFYHPPIFRSSTKHDCAQTGKPFASIEGNGGSYDFTGACDTILVKGNGNTISIAAAKQVTVQGNDNKLTLGTVDALQLSPRDPKQPTGEAGSQVVSGNVQAKPFSGEVKVDQGEKVREIGRKPIEAQCPEEVAEHGAAEGHQTETEGHEKHTAHKFPCWKPSHNPLVCADILEGPGDKTEGERRAAGYAAHSQFGVLVEYGDHEHRHREIAIAATCKDAPKPATTADLADQPVATELRPGERAIQPRHQESTHEEHERESMGPPPEHTNMFFTIYFAMTGLHGIHVLVGVFVFIWLLFRAAKGHFGPEYFGPVDYAALYWHIVDLIWIFLFPLLYLIH